MHALLQNILLSKLQISNASINYIFRYYPKSFKKINLFLFTYDNLVSFGQKGVSKKITRWEYQMSRSRYLFGI